MSNLANYLAMEEFLMTMQAWGIKKKRKEKETTQLMFVKVAMVSKKLQGSKKLQNQPSKATTTVPEVPPVGQY